MSLLRVKAFKKKRMRGGVADVNDSEIVDLFLSRDEEAIKLTSDKYGVRLRHLANNILCNLSDAEECENDTYLKTWNLIPPNEPKSYFFAFLARITRHISLDKCKEKNRIKRQAVFVELTSEMEECIPSPDGIEAQINESELSKIVSDFLRIQSEDRRKMFIRRYWYMDSVLDISNRYSISESKVKTTLFRVRNELREYLKTEGYYL